MAYFERVDTRNDGNPILVLCNICNVKCAERSITTHKMKCRDKHPDKFKNGKLEKCPYDTGHIIEGGKMDLHLEFCNKYQSKLIGEFQMAMARANNVPEEFPLPFASEPYTRDNSWNIDANSDFLVTRMGYSNKI